MKLRLIKRAESERSYVLRFQVPNDEQRYVVSDTGDGPTFAMVVDKDAGFGDLNDPEVHVDRRRAANAEWFNSLAVGEVWELKRKAVP